MTCSMRRCRTRLPPRRRWPSMSCRPWLGYASNDRLALVNRRSYRVPPTTIGMSDVETNDTYSYIGSDYGLILTGRDLTRPARCAGLMTGGGRGTGPRVRG